MLSRAGIVECVYRALREKIATLPAQFARKPFPKPGFSEVKDRPGPGTIPAKWRPMARGSKSKYTDKQKRQAEHIEESYEKRGASKKTAEQRAWQTVNKQTGGGEKSGGGRKAKPSAKKAARRESGRRAAASRKKGSRAVQKKPTRHKASASA
jgi:plasmid stabilization system protein ParE